jgi:hypothetical protein
MWDKEAVIWDRQEVIVDKRGRIRFIPEVIRDKAVAILDEGVV